MKGRYHIWRFLPNHLALRMETVLGYRGQDGRWWYWADAERRGVNAVWQSRQLAQNYAAARWDKQSFIVLECRFDPCRYCSDTPGDPLVELIYE